MQFDPKKIYWQAHRGGGGLEAPDNTLYAMRYGWSLGGIPEADIRVTCDREVVCLHDNTLARTTDAPPEVADIPVGELDLAEVKKYDAGKRFRADCAGEKVPTVREVFEIMRGDPAKMLYADIKNYDDKLFPVLLDGFLSLAREYGVASRVIVAGRDYALNCRFKELCPELKTMQWIGGPPPARMRTFRDLAAKKFFGLDLVQLHLYAVEDAVEGWMYDLSVAELREAFDALGTSLEVFPFGPFTEAAVKTLLELGIRQFATDEPRRFSRTLEALR
jgi:glycerophosphoryl diester phosphodiesterase